MSSFGPVLAALVEGGGRFVVVGGFATVLHGYARLTMDIDVMVDLAPGEAIKPIAALTRIGMQPRAPVDARDFADPDMRRLWIDDKGMRVFSMWDPRRPMVEVDVFVDPPISFDAVWSRSVPVDVEGHSIRIAAIPDLIGLKRIAGRPKDLDDIAARGDSSEEASMSAADEWGTWEDAQRRKYLKGLELTIDERLAWLDEMVELARKHGASPKPRDVWGQPIESR